MTDRKRSPGRPRKSAEGTRRRNVTIRMNDDLYDRIEGAATASRSSLSDEIARRLELSFTQENFLGGPEMRNVVMAMIGAFNSGGWANSGGKPAAEWIGDKRAYSAAVRSVMSALLLSLPDATHADVKSLIEGIHSSVLTRWAQEDQNNG